MKLSDYIVEFFVRKGIKDFFGYQGTMIAHFVDSIERNEEARNHSCYNEQGAAFAACGYAQAINSCACAYATSGPGAVNLLSGVANAYFDSLPVIFLTGQINTNEYTGIDGLRQHAFQEIDIVSMAKPVTKYAVQITDEKQIVEELNKAYYIANSGRKGPVLVDLPMNIQRGNVSEPVYDMDNIAFRSFSVVDPRELETAADQAVDQILETLAQAERPVMLLGNGICDKQTGDILCGFAREHNIPVVTSVLGMSLLAAEDPINFGCIGGAYGHRYANMITNIKSDLLICLGISMCTRQTGVKIHDFAVDAKIIRVDIDPCNMLRDVHENGKNELKFLADVASVAKKLTEKAGSFDGDYALWLEKCGEIRNKLNAVDEVVPERYVNKLVERISAAMGHCSAVAVDVGQHMVWGYSSYKNLKGQQMLFSGGHGAMGYALPAAIGAYYATGKPTACICGDGAFQMNIQELQWVVREKIPVSMFVLNNSELGLICQQQESLFKGLYAGAAKSGGFTSCSFEKVAAAYGIKATAVNADISAEQIRNFSAVEEPNLMEVVLDFGTYAYPKTCFGEPIHNQQPYAPKEIYDQLLSI